MEDRFYQEVLDYLKKNLTGTSVNIERSILNYSINQIPYFSISGDGNLFEGRDKSEEFIEFETMSASFKNMSSKIGEFIRNNYGSDDDIGLLVFKNAWMSVMKYYPLVGKVLSQLKVRQDKRISTLGVMYSQEENSYVMLFNPNFILYSAAMALGSRFLMLKSQEGVKIDEAVDSLSKELSRVAENGVKFLILHEAYHIIEAHVSSSQGNAEVTKEENIVQDSQINTKLAKVLGKDIPENIKLEGVSDGFMFYFNFSEKKLRNYLVNNNLNGSRYVNMLKKDLIRADLSIKNKIALLLNDLGATDVMDGKYLYVNMTALKKDFKLSYDNLIEIVSDIKEFTVNEQIDRKSQSLSDVIKDNLKDIGDSIKKRKEVEEVKKNGGWLYAIHYSDADVLQVLVGVLQDVTDLSKYNPTVVVAHVWMAVSNKGILDSKSGSVTKSGFKNSFAGVDFYKPKFADKNLALKENQLLLLYSPEDERSKVVVFRGYADTDYVSMTDGYGVLMKCFDPEFGINGYYMSCFVQKIYSEPPYFQEGDRVVTRDNIKGIVRDAYPEENSYSIEDTKSGDYVNERAENMKYDKFKAKFKEGVPIVIKRGKNAGKIGIIKKVPDDRDGDYEVNVLSDDTAQSVLDSMEKHERMKLEEQRKKFS